jgi:HK97 gp10 family phage protein
MAVILNLDRLLSKFDNLSNADLTTPLTNACLLVENEAKRKCPVDTGQLRQSITHKIEGNVGVVGTNVEYAPYVEYGTGKYAVAGNGRQTPWAYQDTETGEWIWTEGAKAQPFLEPALLENEKEIIQLFKKAIEEGVK